MARTSVDLPKARTSGSHRVQRYQGPIQVTHHRSRHQVLRGQLSATQLERRQPHPRSTRARTQVPQVLSSQWRTPASRTLVQRTARYQHSAHAWSVSETFSGTEALSVF
jgi:hypothetical protein